MFAAALGRAKELKVSIRLSTLVTTRLAARLPHTHIVIALLARSRIGNFVAERGPITLWLERIHHFIVLDYGNLLYPVCAKHGHLNHGSGPAGE